MEDAGFCTCGAWGDALERIRDMLKVISVQGEGRTENLSKLIPDDGVCHIFLCWMDKAGWLEHGGAIGGAWLTPLGHQVHALLKDMAADDLEEIFSYL